MYRYLGVHRYDFYGTIIDPAPSSKAAGRATFKDRSGAKLLQGHTWKCHINTLKSAIYSFGVRWPRHGEIVDAEHHELDQNLIAANSCRANPERADIPANLDDVVEKERGN